MFCQLLCPLCLVCSVYIYYILMSCLFVYLFCGLLYLHLLSMPLLYYLMSCPLRLHLLCLGRLSVPSTSSMTRSIYICYLCLIYSVCNCYVLVSYLLIYIFHGSLRLCLLFVSFLYCLVPRLFRLHLLCFGELSALSASSVTYSICVYYLCLAHSICICCVLVSCLLHLRFP